MTELSAEDRAYYKEFGTTVCPECGEVFVPAALGGGGHECDTPTTVS